jgi:hypothetical protein
MRGIMPVRWNIERVFIGSVNIMTKEQIRQFLAIEQGIYNEDNIILYGRVF